MTLTELPPVAQKIYHFCKKCDCERYHVVLSHSDPLTAKIQCEVCQKKSTLSLKKKKPASASKRKNLTVSKASTPEKWHEIVTGHSGETKPYDQKQKYTANSKIEHARFGVGVVTTVIGNQIDVIFREGTKSLVHNRVALNKD
jgi:hypothetical protein